ncbi:MAG: VanW family protein [Butyrivibrio sp.]|nr:VanW family protein [Butyrivibrio sp.]
MIVIIRCLANGKGEKVIERRLFCEISPLTYDISRKKEITIRHIKNVFSKDKIARTHSNEELPNIVKSHSSILLRKLLGVDMKLQENKVTNIKLACEKINGIIIRPGETFSYWCTVGPADKKHNYLEGLVISGKGLMSGYGGGLCQMANMIHWLVLNSPLKVTELHHHSDALFPDERRRVPFGTGTSVCYNNIDYRFYNCTDQTVQILVWVEGTELCGELRSEREFPQRYRLTEENHHYRKEKDGRFYRISQVYRTVIDRKSGEEIRKELVLDNHSQVMYDYSYIPKDEIRE